MLVRVVPYLVPLTASFEVPFKICVARELAQTVMVMSYIWGDVLYQKTGSPDCGDSFCPIKCLNDVTNLRLARN